MADKDTVRVRYLGQADELNGVKKPYGKEFELTEKQIAGLGGQSSGHQWEAVRKSDAEVVERASQAAPRIIGGDPSAVRPE